MIRYAVESSDGNSYCLNSENGFLPEGLAGRNQAERFSPAEKAVLAERLRSVWTATKPKYAQIATLKELGVDTGIYPGSGSGSFNSDGFFVHYPDNTSLAPGRNDVYLPYTLETPEDFFPLGVFNNFASQRKTEIHITLIAPYIPNLRSDRPIQKEGYTELPIPPFLFNLLKQSGVNRIITVDTHSPAVSWYALEKLIAILDLSAIPAMFMEGVNHNLYTNPLFLSADDGSLEKALLAQKLALSNGFENTEIIQGNKSKESGRTCVHFTPESLKNVAGKTVVIAEDIIATGGTICSVIEQVQQADAVNIVVLATFGLFTGDSVAKLTKFQNTTIITTDARTPFKSIDSAQNIITIPIQERLIKVAELDMRGVDFWGSEGQQDLAALGLALAPWQTHHGDI